MNDDNYVIAIPSYQRSISLETKTLKTLKDGGVPQDKIFIFVANNEEYDIYNEKLKDKKLHHQIIVGEPGITKQRIFISKFFKEGLHIISCDDDIEEFQEFIDKKNKKKIENLIPFFKYCFKECIDRKSFLWGLYPKSNPYWMNDRITTGLYNIIGVCHGYINRHNEELYPERTLAVKSDIHQTILFYLNDKVVVRFDKYSYKTKFNAVGGLGKFRFKQARYATDWLTNKYPKLCKGYERKKGEAQVTLNWRHSFENTDPELIDESDIVG